ncbi:hypothetical protein H9Q72_014613, partial [Fusarium xylarioides]
HTTVQSSNTLRHYTVTMPAIRRSLQPAQDNRAYQTRCHKEVIPMINLFINRDDYADLHNIAMEIGLTWQRKDDASCIKQAAFGCEVLKVI